LLEIESIFVSFLIRQFQGKYGLIDQGNN